METGSESGARRASRVVVPPAGGESVDSRGSQGAKSPQNGRHRPGRLACNLNFP